MASQLQDKPNGPAAAVLLAAGIGALILGLMVTAAEASRDIGGFLDFAKNYGIGAGVGPLSGKVVLATGGFLISWLILGLAWRGKEVNLRTVTIVSMVLLAIGFLLTFPPIFELFAPAE
jgi:hypothetical protein